MEIGVVILNNNKSVIVTYANNRIAYNIVKSLGRRGISVHSCGPGPFSMSFASKYSKDNFLYPSPFKYQKEFIDCIIQNIDRLNAGVLIPVYEEAYLLSKYKKELEKHVRMVLPDYESILLTHNKDKWVPIAKGLKISVPEQYSIDELRNGNKLINNMQFPVLIKPKQGGGSWAISQLNSYPELDKVISQKKYYGQPLERFFVQNKIEGDVVCVAMLFCKGKYRAKVSYKQLRDLPATGGQATLRISVHSDQAEEYFEKFLKDLSWHGICQADFVIESGTNIPYLIDINPRFWGSLVQGTASGVDFPFLLYKIATEGDVEIINSFKINSVTRWLGGDIIAFPQHLKLSNKKINLLKEYIFPNYKNMIYDDLDIKDPCPMLFWIIDKFYSAIKNKFSRNTSEDFLKGIWE